MTVVPIRDRTPADLPSCVALLHEVHRADRYPRQWPPDPERWLTPRGLVAVLVAVDDDDRVVGHVAVVGRDQAGGDGVLELSRLFVAPHDRGRGVGAALVEAVVRLAPDRASRLVLEVVEDRSGAAAFYERQGWSRTDRLSADWRLPDGSRPTLLRYERVIRPTRTGPRSRRVDGRMSG
jgi:GNAT superfamily N-acetyltransferase